MRTPSRVHQLTLPCKYFICTSYFASHSISPCSLVLEAVIDFFCKYSSVAHDQSPLALYLISIVVESFKYINYGKELPVYSTTALFLWEVLMHKWHAALHVIGLLSLFETSLHIVLYLGWNISRLVECWW